MPSNIKSFLKQQVFLGTNHCFIHCLNILKNMTPINFLFFFHAGSTGEEAYSFVMYNKEKYGFNLEVNIGEYEQNAV